MSTGGTICLRHRHISSSRATRLCDGVGVYMRIIARPARSHARSKKTIHCFTNPAGRRKQVGEGGWPARSSTTHWRPLMRIGLTLDEYTALRLAPPADVDPVFHEAARA